MPEMLLSIPIPEDSRGGAAGQPRAGGRAEVQLLDEHDAPLGEPVAVEVPEPVAVEGRGEAGEMAWGLVTPPATLAIEVPEVARKLRVAALGGGRPQVFALSALGGAAAPKPAARRSFPPEGARWTLAVLPERFEDEATFFAHCETLFAFIEGQAPFGDTGVSFGIQALFWPCPPGKTLFGASDDRIKGRILSGDTATAQRFLGAAGVAPNKTLVLINSTRRAGAGGFKAETPSWTTVTADPPERWEGVALHELGHAFGLADEYDNAFDLPEPNPLEPNVSKEADPNRVSWSLLCNVHAPATVPTAKRGEEAAHDLGTVGTFQGARYHETNRYRPSPFCRMRMTTMPFCKVCREQIRAELLR